MIQVLVQLFGFYKRYRYGTSAVAPLGLVLSLIADCIMLFTGWKGEEMVFRAALSTGRFEDGLCWNGKRRNLPESGRRQHLE